MKTKFSVLAFFCLLLTAGSMTAIAQDEIPSGPELNNVTTVEANGYDEKQILFETESRAQSRANVKDSIQVRVATPVRSKSNDPRKLKDETDPLNFNFLYYIIQKFKTADLVDE